MVPLTGALLLLLAQSHEPYPSTIVKTVELGDLHVEEDTLTDGSSGDDEGLDVHRLCPRVSQRMLG